MNAYIKIWGNEYLVSSLDWHTDGTLSHASFHDENGKYHTVFDGSALGGNNAEEDRHMEGVLLHAYLDEIVVFTEKKSRSYATQESIDTL